MTINWVLQGCPGFWSIACRAAAHGTLKVVWYAAGEGDAPGLYFAESRDKATHFLATRSLLMQETVKGTPALAAGNASGHDRAIAIWQGSVGQQH